jgi:hypothetical protein
MHLSTIASTRARYERKALALVTTIATYILLCGFMKPITPVTSYTGIPYAKLVAVYQSAYAHVGMTQVEVTSVQSENLEDGTLSTIKDYSFSYPPGAKHRKTGGTIFGVIALTKDGICVECNITRTGYWADPAADLKATNEIKRILGKSVPVIITTPGI